MPDDLQEQMSVDDLVDLVEYLSRLQVSLPRRASGTVRIFRTLSHVEGRRAAGSR